MKNRMAYWLKKYVWNLPTLAAGLLLGVLIINAGGLTFAYNADLLEGLQNGFILGMTAYIIPVVVCFPAVMRFSEERAGGYSIFSQLRTSNVGYIVRRLGGSMLSSGMVMLLGILVYTIYMAFRCLRHGIPLTCTGSGFFGTADNPEPAFYYHMIAAGMEFVVYLANVMYLLCYAAFFGVVGTVVSVFVTNRRVAVVSPMLFLRLESYILPSGLFCLSTWNLRLSAWAAALPLGGIWYAPLYILVAFLLGLGILLARDRYGMVRG